MANSQNSKANCLPWLTRHSTGTIENAQSMHLEVLQTVQDSNSENNRQIGLPHLFFKTECSEKTQRKKNKSPPLGCENTQRCKRVCRGIRSELYTSSLNYNGKVVSEPNTEDVTADGNTMMSCSAPYYRQTMSIETSNAENIASVSPMFQNDGNEDLYPVNTESNISQHMLDKTRTVREQQISSNCSKPIISTRNYSNDLKFFNKEKHLECGISGNFFSRKLACHNSGRSLTCEFCNKTFARIENLNKHLKFHTG